MYLLKNYIHARVCVNNRFGKIRKIRIRINNFIWSDDVESICETRENIINIFIVINQLLCDFYIITARNIGNSVIIRQCECVYLYKLILHHYNDNNKTFFYKWA